MLVCLSLCGFSPVFAETRNVPAEGSSTVCWGRETALKVARVDTENDAREECRALGRAWTLGEQAFSGFEQCERCGQSDGFRCTIKQAMYACVNMQRERAEAEAKARAARDAERLAKRSKSEQEKAKAESLHRDQQEQVRRDNQARHRRAVEKAEREQAAQRVAAEKALAAAGPAGGNVLDEAFAPRHKKTAPVSSGNVLDDGLRQRSERLAEREKVAVLKTRTEEATAFCQAQAKGADACLQAACGSEPAQTYCSDGSTEIVPCKPKPGSSCLSLPTYVCRAHGPNPAHPKWQACTHQKRASCEPHGSVDDCVKQRLRGAS